MTFQRRWAKTQSASVYSHEHRDVEMAAPNIIPAPPPPQAHPPPPPPPPVAMPQANGQNNIGPIRRGLGYMLGLLPPPAENPVPILAPGPLLPPNPAPAPPPAPRPDPPAPNPDPPAAPPEHPNPLPSPGNECYNCRNRRNIVLKKKPKWWSSTDTYIKSCNLEFDGGVGNSVDKIEATLSQDPAKYHQFLRIAGCIGKQIIKNSYN